MGQSVPINMSILTDAYKETHYRLLDPDIEYVYSYLESRGVNDKGVAPETLFFGLQMLMKTYMEGEVINQNMIEEGREFCKNLFGDDYFNYDGFTKLIAKHGGKLPVRIKALPEGIVVPSHNILVSIENTDPEFPWLVNFLETILLNGTWYPITVATTSYAIKKLILKYAEITGGSDFVYFHLNDFGYRGCSSIETAGIGGAAHLVNFYGTDTLRGIQYANFYYKAKETCKTVGMSVPASEHSATIGWGKNREKEAYEHFMKAYPNGILSIVSDSYDLYNAVDKIFGQELKNMIFERNGQLVVRPDSGYPPQVALQTIKLLDKYFGSETNTMGFKTLNNKVRVIYGDFIRYGMIDDILSNLMEAGYSTDNIVFGMGGALLQQVHRDTYKFAFKTSAVKRKESTTWTDAKKEPSTDAGKNSKAGRMILTQDENGEFHTELETPFNKDKDILVTVFENGKIVKEWNFAEIRHLSEALL